MTLAQALYFTAPRQVEVRPQTLPAPAPGQALLQTICSAISPGTEMLVYRGQFPADVPVDENFPGMSESFQYPLTYGYSSVGQVVEVGDTQAAEMLGKRFFSFHPHASHYLAPVSALIPLPEGMPPEAACFLANMETAVNLIQDGAPLWGEDALALGQGIVGLLLASLLRQFPLRRLLTVDSYPLRRAASLALGADDCLNPLQPDVAPRLRALLPQGADLTFEVSGAPEALNTAIEQTGFGGRVILGSWYGQKAAPLRLGGWFHRSRLRLISSQVSTIAPELSARWDKSRRFSAAWKALEQIQPQRWITHRFPLGQAQAAYRLLDEAPQEAIQVVFTPSPTEAGG